MWNVLEVLNYWSTSSISEIGERKDVERVSYRQNYCIEPIQNDASDMFSK